jgi:hypothetical protein
MKFFILYFISLSCLCATAQEPQSFSYQSICRNTNVSPLHNQVVHSKIEFKELLKSQTVSH